jgi:hypothetical protein
MAFPGDPSGPAAKRPGAFAGARLTPDDFEQLAAAFRPSWEFDEAPFTGSGAMSPADMRLLQGGGTHADVRAVAAVPAAHAQPAPPAHAVAVAQPALVSQAPQPAPVAAHPLPKPTVSHEPEDSVIIDRSITAADIAGAARTPIGPPLAVVAPAPPAPRSPDRLAHTRIVARPQVPVPVAPESTGSFAAGADFRGGSKKPLWIGLGAGVVALAAVGIWATSGSSDAVPPAPATIAKTVDPPSNDRANSRLNDIPPPPETTAAAAPPPPPPKAAPRTVEISSLAQVPTPMVAAPAPAPQPTRPPTVTPASLPPGPRGAPAPAPAPAPRPAARPTKPAAGTIVHDVPF